MAIMHETQGSKIVNRDRDFTMEILRPQGKKRTLTRLSHTHICVHVSLQVGRVLGEETDSAPMVPGKGTHGAPRAPGTHWAPRGPRRGDEWYSKTNWQGVFLEWVSR